MKKLISLLLAGVILCSAVPFMASAVEDIPTEPATPSEDIAESVGETGNAATAEIALETGTTAIATTEEFTEASSSTEPKESETSADVTADTSTQTTEIEATTEPIETTEPAATTEPVETTKATEATSETAATAPSTTQATEPTTVKIYPSPIKKFKVSKRTANKITLTWNKSKNATRYYLYKASENSKGVVGSYKLYKTFKNKDKQSFTDKNLRSGAIHKYKLVAACVKKKYTTKSKAVSVKTVTLMLAPKTIKVKKAKSSYITIAWSKVQGARKYQIYRKPLGGTEKLIAKVDTTSYKDEKITSGNKYTYRVKPYRVVDKKTYYAPSKSILATAGISGVNGITAKSYLNRALLTWKKVNGADGYDVFSVSQNGKYKLKETKSTPSYLSGKLTDGKTYKYAVRSFVKNNGAKNYSKEKTVTVTITSEAFGQTPGDSYIEVCTETQEVYMYVNNKLYVKTPVVTGNDDGRHNTTHGFHKIINKKTPARLKGETWDVEVKYWLAFTYDGQGLHDSTWRYSGYGGEIYKGDGSHGCVNTPYDAISKIFSKAYCGMPVIVY